MSALFFVKLLSLAEAARKDYLILHAREHCLGIGPLSFIVTPFKRLSRAFALSATSTMKTDPDAPQTLYARPGNDADRNLPTAERDGLFVPETDEHGYKILEQPYGTKKHVRVILMGAGASTLNFLKKAEEQMSSLKITVYEKNKDVGGTWFENVYAGAACDIPSVNYQFSWKIKLWSHYYSYSPEIFQYLKEIEQENDFINKYIKLKHQVQRAEWDENEGVWRVQLLDLTTGREFTDEAEFFINAGGVLNNWKWPDVPGLHNFTGKLMHSASYDPNYPISGKRVAVLGAGSSGLQIVSNIQPKVEHLYHWVRSPIWVTSNFGHTFAGRDGANFAYSQEQLDFLRENPKQYLKYRKQIEDELNQRFKFIIKGSDEAKVARDFAFGQMDRKLKSDPRLADKMIPKNFNPGCRRPTPAPGYLEALVASNSTIFTDPITSITPKGFIDHEGKEHEVDVIICATGFDTSWIPRFPFIAHGRDLRDIWAGGNNVTPYLSIAIPDFPNHFSFCGPYGMFSSCFQCTDVATNASYVLSGPLGHGSFMPLIESWTRYMFNVIEKVQTENIKSITPRMAPSLQFRQHADLFLKRTSWTSPCRSWFKQGKTDGQAAIYPGSRLHFFELLKAPRYEDYDIKYWNQNLFSFLGNGFEMRELDGRDITNYLGLLEEGQDVQPEYNDELVNRLAGWTLPEDSAVRGG